MASITHNPLSLLCLAIAVLASSQTGCSLLQPGKTSAAAAQPDAVPVATYRVKIIGKGSPKEITGQLDRSKTVQTVLEETGAVDMFTRMEIVVGRKSESQEANGGMGYYRLESDFDPESRNVVLAQDYAIHPGDVIVITKDSTTALDSVMSKFSNAMGG